MVLFLVVVVFVEILLVCVWFSFVDERMFFVVCIFKVVFLVNEKVVDGFVVVGFKDDVVIVVFFEVIILVVFFVVLGWVLVRDLVLGVNVIFV